MLAVKKLSIKLGSKQILDELTFAAYPKEVMIISGANGSGKSTLFNAIAGLIPPTEGSIECFGRSIVNEPPHMLRRSGLAYLPQDGCVFPDLTIQENLRLSELSNRARENETSLGELLWQCYFGSSHQRAGMLSQGQQQLLSFEMTLASKPKVLLLDEPFAPLSLRLRKLVADFVADYTMLSGCVTIVAEHDYEALSAVMPTRHLELIS